uniref:Cell division protein FtsK/SpoIIIE n=1 Tax=uncultured bacterium Contig1495 TaxID=1393440 RepID=W0FPL6_9BACT|nr:cell division protein FtsK/SpoIIIE [uncultured bacterium Contig1495]
MYSADAMAVRYMAGLVLIALGVLIFMAVELGLSGNIFEGLRRLCFGACGFMAYVLPVLPVWAGVLVIWSTQRRAPVRPWLFAFLAFFGLCAFIMIISGALDWMKRSSAVNTSNWGAVTNYVYQDCSSRMERAGGGGALGAIIAWPLWNYLGPVLGTVIVFLLTVFCLLMAMNLTPSRLHDIFTGQADIRKEQQQLERERMEQQQVAWQQQQALAWQQQQQIIEQQQQQQYQQPYTQQPYTARENMAYTQPPVQQWPAQNDGGVSAWQEQAAAGQMDVTGHQSQIFGRKETTKPASAGKAFVSRIFGREKKEEYDGLSDGSTLAQTAKPVRRTVTDKPVQPQTDWKPRQPAEERPVKTEQNRNQRPETARQTSFDIPEEQAPVRREPVQKEEPVRDDSQYRRPSHEEKKTLEKPLVQPAIPVAEPIGEKTWKPPIKVPPKKNEAEEDEGPWMPTPYNFPPITDLAKPQAGVGDTSMEDMARSRKLEETLASFRVPARVVHVTHGPAISRFELELEAGTKVNKVAELEKDIAYGMSATSVRIEAPIPGKRLVGVEVPNQKVTTVTLREVMESEQMQNAKSILTIALGKDIAGTPIVCDLAKMPHMLIAGQTGSGKSVCINAIINSLLYRASPDEVKLILVDPKVVELQCYNGIPHLLIPVVNDPRKAAAALAWAVAEMLERYDKFAEKKVRNLEGYNQQAEKTGEKPMARIVIIIDELADLMMVCKKDVEEYICRLTQLARAAGIHLIVATQRPSVDVITGLIKANIPSRIAFKTAQSVDSRTILDRNGAEQLLGWGDMLYAPTGSFAPTRVQGCFLSDEEVNRIAKHVRDANPSTYDPDILEKLDELASGGSEGGGADIIINSSDMSGGDGGLFEQAVEFAIQDGQISTSTLQRRLKIGYARAGRLTDEMEERGIVAAKDGSKPRKCLITREEWEEMKRATEGMS